MLQQFDCIIWVDGSVQIKSENFVRDFSKEPMTVIKHPWRDCVYDEALRGKDLRKYPQDKTDRQIQCYRDNKYPEHNGLYCGTVFAFHRNRATNKIINEWWRQCTVFTMQDQLSLPYLLWHCRFKPTVLDIPINDNEYFKKEAHLQRYYQKIRREPK